MEGKDPVALIRDGMAWALVPCYPFASRLRKGPRRKLSVECNGEGVLFIEANAYAHLTHFGDVLHPRFPCFDQLLYRVLGYDGIANCPLAFDSGTHVQYKFMAWN